MDKNLSQIFNNSKFIKLLFNVYKTQKYNITNYSKTSTFVKLAEKLKKDLYLIPVRTIGIILITAILTNSLCSIVFNIEIKLLGWVMRVLFLFIGLISLFCDANWEDLKKTSSVIRYFNNFCKTRN